METAGLIKQLFFSELESYGKKNSEIIQGLIKQYAKEPTQSNADKLQYHFEMHTAYNKLLDHWLKNNVKWHSNKLSSEGAQGPSITYTNDAIMGLNGPAGTFVVSGDKLGSYFGPR